MDGHLWVTAAVRFVAGLFVRDPAFEHDFSRRLPEGVAELVFNPSSNAMAARLIDFQVLLAPVMAAHWTVVHFPESCELVTSDVGYAGTSTPSGELPSYVIPTDVRTAVVITPRDVGAPLTWRNDRWVANLVHVDADPGEVAGLNRAIGAFARQEVYGPSCESVVQAEVELGQAPPIRTGHFPGLDPASHLYDWFRGLSILGSGPDNAQARADTIDWSLVEDADWGPLVVVEVGFPERTRGGLRLEGEDLKVDLRYGLGIRRSRREGHDFNMGMLRLVDLKRFGTGTFGRSLTSSTGSRTRSGGADNPPLRRHWFPNKGVQVSM